MSASLRPMTLGEILDRTFQIYRSRFRFFLAIGALPVLAMLGAVALGLLLDAILSQTTLAGTTKRALEDFASGIPLDALQSLFRFAAWPIVIYAAAKMLFRQSRSFRATLAECRTRWRGWVGISILLWAVWDGIPALMYRLPILERARLNAMLTLRSLRSIEEWPRSLFFLWAGSLVALVVSVTLWFCVPVWLLEDLGLRAALARGRILVRRARARIAIAWLLVSFLGWILTESVSVLLFLTVRMLIALHRPDMYFGFIRVAITIPAFAASILVTPLFPIALTLLYYDQRMRREGFDIEWMMNAAGMHAPESAESPVEPVVAVEAGEQPA